jgi:hypothetical protein
MGNTVHNHLSLRVEIFLNSNADDNHPYEAQLTGDGYQHRGYGISPKAAIYDAMEKALA